MSEYEIVNMMDSSDSSSLGAKMALLPVAPIISSEAASTSEITNAKYS